MKEKRRRERNSEKERENGERRGRGNRIRQQSTAQTFSTVHQDASEREKERRWSDFGEVRGA